MFLSEECSFICMYIYWNDSPNTFTRPPCAIPFTIIVVLYQMGSKSSGVLFVHVFPCLYSNTYKCFYELSILKPPPLFRSHIKYNMPKILFYSWWEGRHPPTIPRGVYIPPLVTESRLINCLNHESQIIKYPIHKSREIIIFTDHSKIKLQQNIGRTTCSCVLTVR